MLADAEDVETNLVGELDSSMRSRSRCAELMVRPVCGSGVVSAKV
jgi:hypothetical protein